MFNKLKKFFANLAALVEPIIDGMADGAIYENIVISNGGGVNIQGALR